MCDHSFGHNSGNRKNNSQVEKTVINMHVQISAFHLTTVDGVSHFPKGKIGVISDSTNEIMQAFDGSGFSAKKALQKCLLPM